MFDGVCVPTIHLLEDKKGDILLFNIAMEQLPDKWQLQLVDELDVFMEKIRISVQKKEPILIITDWYSPVVSGLDLITTVRKEFTQEEIPIIVLSGTTEEKTVHKAYLEGANCFIYKEIDFGRFVKKLGKIVNYYFEG